MELLKTTAAARYLGSTLPADEIPVLLGELEGLKARPWARLTLLNGSGWAERPAQPDRRLNVHEPAEKLGVSKDYLCRHADRQPFTVRIGRGLGFYDAGSPH
jgi:hypothetical protein